MPLSEHEQKVLDELEQSLRREDPVLAKKVHETTVYRASGRQIRWSVLGFLVGLAILVLFFRTNVFLGLLGVATMFASAVVIERNLRRLGRASVLDLGLTAKARAATEGVVRNPPRWARWIQPPNK